MRIINSFSPTMLHFFCHGTTKPVAYLEVANQATHDLGDQPLYLSHDEIRGVSGSFFLVTLNACEGAAPVPDSHSLAMAIANESGVPVVVGMREAIDAQDANLFTGAFYQALLQELHRALSNPQAEISKLAGTDAGTTRPVGLSAGRAAGSGRCGPQAMVSANSLHARRRSCVFGGPGNMEQLGELQALRSLRGKFSKDSPPGYLAEIDKRIAELEEALPM